VPNPVHVTCELQSGRQGGEQPALDRRDGLSATPEHALLPQLLYPAGPACAYSDTVRCPPRKCSGEKLGIGRILQGTSRYSVSPPGSQRSGVGQPDHITRPVGVPGGAMLAKHRLAYLVTTALR